MDVQLATWCRCSSASAWTVSEKSPEGNSGTIGIDGMNGSSILPKQLARPLALLAAPAMRRRSCVSAVVLFAELMLQIEVHPKRQRLGDE